MDSDEIKGNYKFIMRDLMDKMGSVQLKTAGKLIKHYHLDGKHHKRDKEIECNIGLDDLLERENENIMILLKEKEAWIKKETLIVTENRTLKI